MANSVDPDQTAPLGAVWSGSALFAQAYLSENLGSLWYPDSDSQELCCLAFKPEFLRQFKIDLIVSVLYNLRILETTLSA